MGHFEIRGDPTTEGVLFCTLGCEMLHVCPRRQNLVFLLVCRQITRIKDLLRSSPVFRRDGRDRALPAVEVTVRINIESSADSPTVVSVHGWIEGDDEARELLRVARDAPAPVVLDLEELRTADTSGLTVLTTLAAEGVKLTRASDFIMLLLESNGLSSPVPAGETNGGAL